MRFESVTFVRIYITEKSKELATILDYLKHKSKIRGFSVFRAISGFGESGAHASSLLDISFDLPLAIEFFDHPDKVDTALEYLNTLVKSEHIVCWEAQANERT